MFTNRLITIYQGDVGSLGVFSSDQKKKMSLVIDSFGNLQKYISRIHTGQRSPASGHENNGTTLFVMLVA